jgi:ligand-binding sensor domain-containing protein
VYTSENFELPWGKPLALTFDAQGNVWVASYGGGLAQFDGETWTIYNKRNSGLPSDSFHSGLLFDGQGKLWIGTEQGVATFDGESWMVHDKDNSGLPNNFIWILALDTQGNTWIGTYGGLAVYREGGVILKGMNK